MKRICELTAQKACSDLKYWSNDCGELHHWGEFDITEDELPEPLKKAYRNTWSENYDFYCYLMETAKDGYCVALIAEYDKTYGEDVGKTVEELWEQAKTEAHLLENHKEFDAASFYVCERSGFDDCHEVIVCFPANIKKEELEAASRVMNEIIYHEGCSCSGCTHYYSDFKNDAGECFCSYYGGSTDGSGCGHKK